MQSCDMQIGESSRRQPFGGKGVFLNLANKLKIERIGLAFANHRLYLLSKERKGRCLGHVRAEHVARCNQLERVAVDQLQKSDHAPLGGVFQREDAVFAQAVENILTG